MLPEIHARMLSRDIGARTQIRDNNHVPVACDESGTSLCRRGDAHSSAARSAFSRPDSQVGYARIPQTVGMPLTTEDVYARLAEADPRAAEFLVEHLKAWHDVQDPYLLMEELRDFCLQLFHEGSLGPVEAILGVISAAFVEGNFDVTLAIEGDFIGHLPPWTSEMKPFVAAWPPVLKAEAARQTEVWTK